MNPILLCFLCGAAFIGGAVVVVVFVAMTVSFKDKENREKLHGYWVKSLENHSNQLLMLDRIAGCMEKSEAAKIAEGQCREIK